MSRRDFDRDTFVKALIKDGWTITRDPLTLEYGGRNLYVDLAADKPVLAQKDGLKIAIEVKGFQGASDVTEWERALDSSFSTAIYLRFRSQFVACILRCRSRFTSGFSTMRAEPHFCKHRRFLLLRSTARARK